MKKRKAFFFLAVPFVIVMGIAVHFVFDSYQADSTALHTPENGGDAAVCGKTDGWLFDGSSEETGLSVYPGSKAGETVPDHQKEREDVPPAPDSADADQPPSIPSEDDAQMPDHGGTEEPGTGSLDIGLHDIDGNGKKYAFTYGGEEFSAQYTKDNWKIVDSYKITNTEDMVSICQALLDVHPVHGRDMQSIRTAEDMAFEWFQHNLAYAFLPENSPWRQNAKDVDLNPEDQNKTFQEMYEDRTGKEFRLEDLLGQYTP